MMRTLTTVRDDLVRSHGRLVERLRQIRDDEARRQAPLSADSADRAQEQENDEVLARIESATGDLLAQYRHAIERIDAGVYGTCERCGLGIEARRLQAVPHATLCAACAAASA
jgi:DnaK suppressor protein